VLKSRLYIGILVLVLLVLGVGSCRKLGTWLVKSDAPEHADAMVLLMGSFSERVLQTADLYQAQVSGKIWIVEEGMGAYRILEEKGVSVITNSTQARNALVTLGIPADSILILPGDATSTRIEAEACRDYLASQTGIDTLLLVTSAEHSRRAVKVFEAAFKQLDRPVKVLCSPSSYSNFNDKRWWRSRDDIQEVIMEYLKLINFVLFERGDLKRGSGA
jgi:uncharacterized SAM-binding protein YcdF (DUF218 family)